MSSSLFELPENERLDVVLCDDTISNVIAGEEVKIRGEMKIDNSIIETLKHKVRNDETYNELVKQRIKCHTAGCDSACVSEVKLKACKFGEVTLFVFSNCAEKFLDEMLELLIAGGHDPDLRESGYSKEDN